MRLATVWILPAVAGIYLLPVACSGGEPECTDVCPPGISRCDGDNVQTCVTGASGCREWANEVCDDGCEEESSTVATCSTGDVDPTCDDKCDSAGETRCDRDNIQTCTTDSDGCKDWSDTSDCTELGQTCDDSGGSPICLWGVPTLGSEGLTVCDPDEDESEPKTGETGCPAATTDPFIVDFYEVNNDSGDCLWFKGDNLGAGAGSDLFMYVIAPDGTYEFLDDEWGCSITSDWDCPEGSFIAPAADMVVAIGQWDLGGGCTPGESAPYQLFISVNGDAVTPTRLANEVEFERPF